MTNTRYHQVLRTSLVVTAFVLLFDSGFVVPVSKHLSDTTVNYLASSVGVLAQVEPNELNVITAELTKRERELDEREAALRTIASRDFGGTGTTSDISTYVLSIILFLLTALILTNYVMDWRRARILGQVA